jgi:hypothetical protein
MSCFWIRSITSFTTSSVTALATPGIFCKTITLTPGNIYGYRVKAIGTSYTGYSDNYYNEYMSLLNNEFNLDASPEHPIFLCFKNNSEQSCINLIDKYKYNYNITDGELYPIHYAVINDYIEFPHRLEQNLREVLLEL